VQPDEQVVELGVRACERDDYVDRRADHGASSSS
jgi:hypothetical protein